MARKFKISDISPDAFAAGKEEVSFVAHGLSDELLRHLIAVTVNALAEEGTLFFNELHANAAKKAWNLRGGDRAQKGARIATHEDGRPIQQLVSPDEK